VADKACGPVTAQSSLPPCVASCRQRAMFLEARPITMACFRSKRYILGSRTPPRAMLRQSRVLCCPDPTSALCSTESSQAWSPCLTGNQRRRATYSACSARRPGDGNRFPEICAAQSFRGIQALNEPGRPDLHVSNRGNGTAGRVSIPVLNVHKTRLNDPHMWFLGTNDQPGDYRSSGCARVPRSLRERSRFPCIRAVCLGGQHGPEPLRRSGHSKHESDIPLAHRFTRSIPTSQCMTCHMHQPNVFMNTFMGYTMWDYEADAPAMWPEKQKYPTLRRSGPSTTAIRRARLPRASGRHRISHAT